MSDNKSLIHLEMDSESAQVHYQNFNVALQQSEAYRTELHAYEAKLASQPDMIPEDIALFQAIENTFMVASDWVYGEKTTKKPPKTGVELPKEVPNQEELSRLCRLRDAAFFKYMNSLELEGQTVDQGFQEDTRPLKAVDELTKPYLKKSIHIRRTLAAVETNIETLSKSQRSWMDFIIESVIPSFLLKLMAYVNFQELIQDQITSLEEDKNWLKSKHQELDEQFADEWSVNFPGVDKPRDFKAAQSIYVSKYVHDLEIDTLSTAFYQYEKNKTVGKLIDLYRLVSQMYHAASESDHTLIKAQQLKGILHQLELLHPNMAEPLAQEKAITEREMDLLNAYRSLGSPKERSDKKAVFLKELDDKYRAFLTNRSLNTFQDLYEHFHAHPEFRKESLVKKTRTLLKADYAQAYQMVREHMIPHINEQDCEEFLNKYDRRNYDHPIYTKMLEFMREPTSISLTGLQQLMYMTDANYDLDQRFASMVADFMHICSKISVTMVTDLSSELYSVGSRDDMDSVGSLSPGHSPNGRSVRSDSVGSISSVPVLSEQALAQHNVKDMQQYDPKLFGNSGRNSSRPFNGHSLGAPTTAYFLA